MTINSSALLHIVDIGASGGLHSRWKAVGCPVKAVLFEPDPREYERLKAELGTEAIVLNTALSDEAKEIDFYLYQNQKASSVYLPDREILGRYYQDMSKFQVVKQIKVAADTLDNQLHKANLTDIDFIKVDVQGHELPILMGGENTLKQVIGLEVEVEFLGIYKDQPVFHQVDAFVRAAGFELFDIKRTYRNRCNKKLYGNRKGQLLWGDALYFKAPEKVLAQPQLSGNKILQAICVYLAYNYPDLAETLYDLARQEGALSAEMSEEIRGRLAQHAVDNKRNLLPEFRGKKQVYNILHRLTQAFSKQRWTDKYEDSHLGNAF